MDIHIKWNNDQSGIQLPVLPEEFEISSEMNNTSVIIHNLGEINLKGKRKLFSITINSFFPHEQYSFAKTEYHEPYEYYVAPLKALFEANETVHLIITGTDINMYCTIEAFPYGHDERNGDVKYSLTLKEYRAIQSVSVAAGVRAEVTRVTKSTSSSSYTWKKGDTWQKVTKKKLGSSAKWKKVKQNNKAVIKKAKKKYPKKKEKDALVGFKVVVKV